MKYNVTATLEKNHKVSKLKQISCCKAISVKSLLTLASISHQTPLVIWNVENVFWLVQGVRSATLYSPLSADSLFIRGEQPLTVSLGFKSTDRYGSLLRSSSQVNPSCLTPSFKRESKAKLRWLNILWSSAGLTLCLRLPAVPGWWLCGI